MKVLYCDCCKRKISEAEQKYSIEGIMTCGAKYDIDKKFKIHEEILRLQNELKSL